MLFAPFRHPYLPEPHPLFHAAERRVLRLAGFAVGLTEGVLRTTGRAVVGAEHATEEVGRPAGGLSKRGSSRNSCTGSRGCCCEIPALVHAHSTKQTHLPLCPLVAPVQAIQRVTSDLRMADVLDDGQESAERAASIEAGYQRLESAVQGGRGSCWAAFQPGRRSSSVLCRAVSPAHARDALSFRNPGHFPALPAGGGHVLHARFVRKVHVPAHCGPPGSHHQRAGKRSSSGRRPHLHAPPSRPSLHLQSPPQPH